METAKSPACTSCQQLQAQVDTLQAEIAQLREQLAAARKDSSTSSKPPSSDIVKPKLAQDGDAQRAIGGQPGHPKQARELFPPEQVTHFEEHTLDVCPCCGGPLRRNAHFIKVVQQVDIEKPPLLIEQHNQSESSHERMSGLERQVAVDGSFAVTSQDARAFRFIAKSISM